MIIDKTSFRVPRELLKELQTACIQREVLQQQAVAEGIQLWIAYGGGPPQVPINDEIGEIDKAMVPLLRQFIEFMAAEGTPFEQEFKHSLKRLLTLRKIHRRKE